MESEKDRFTRCHDTIHRSSRIWIFPSSKIVLSYLKIETKTNIFKNWPESKSGSTDHFVSFSHANFVRLKVH